MSTANQWKNWIKRLGYPEKPRAERRIPSGFAARQRNSPASKPFIIRNISTSGLFVLTDERWPIGRLVPLIVQVEGAPEYISEPQFAVQARVIRHGEDGMGLTFVLPPDLDANLWEVMLRNTVVLTKPKEIAFTFRMLGTILILCRLCRAEAHEAILLLGGELDDTRTENAMEIVDGAEELLAAEPDGEKLRAHPQLVLSLLKFGSWAHDDLTKQLWAGLLASSCSAEGTDESNQVFVDLLVNVTTSQCHIFFEACRRALASVAGAEGRPLAPIVLAPDEMTRLTGLHDVSRIATDMAYLFNSGLTERNFDFTSYLPMDNFDITPSVYGLELYKRCKGDRIEPPLPLGAAGGSDLLPH
jgi:hypothetical protein